MAEEELLAGGNSAEVVVRAGSTVRKPATPATPAVQSLLRHLRATGCDACPEAYGLDEQGRQSLEFVPGQMWRSGAARTRGDLFRAGSIIRTLHAATAGFKAPQDAQWESYCAPGEHELICHSDLAPWNLVCGENRWAFIDWDAAAPATRLWDLAWAALSFPPFQPDGDLATAAAAMHALLSGYGLEAASYGRLITQMVVRARCEHDRIVEGARSGEQPWVRLYLEDHHRYWGPVAEYVAHNASALENLLMSLDTAK